MPPTVEKAVNWFKFDWTINPTLLVLLAGLLFGVYNWFLAQEHRIDIVEVQIYELEKQVEENDSVARNVDIILTRQNDVLGRVTRIENLLDRRQERSNGQ